MKVRHLLQAVGGIALPLLGLLLETCGGNSFSADGAEHDDAGACVASDRRCSNKTVEICDTAGSWSVRVDCPFACSAGNCAGECDPASVRCNRSTPETCDSRGTWIAGASCPKV